MTSNKFRLPGISYPDLQKIIQAYYEFGNDATLNDIHNLSNLSIENISRNHGFLLDVGIISGNKFKKRITELGEEIGIALKNNDRKKIKIVWRQIINKIKFFDRIKTSFRLQGSITAVKLKNNIIKFAGQNPKPFHKKWGAWTIIEILKSADVVRETSRQGHNPVFELIDERVYTNYYVNHDRIAQLQSLESAEFDFSKLIELCKALNTNYANGHYLAVAMLVRTILNHVPPIFGCKTFSEISSSYNSGTKSFKDSMQLLSPARKIADDHAHSPIRKSEELPNETQVNFSNALDVLLAEIIRILKK